MTLFGAQHCSWGESAFMTTALSSPMKTVRVSQDKAWVQENTPLHDGNVREIIARLGEEKRFSLQTSTTDSPFVFETNDSNTKSIDEVTTEQSNCRETTSTRRRKKPSKDAKKLTAVPLEVNVPVYLVASTLPPTLSNSTFNFLEHKQRPEKVSRKKKCQHQRQQRGNIAMYSRWMCLKLLESDRPEERSIGIEHLVEVTNYELVNCSQFSKDMTEHSLSLSSTIAYSLVFTCESESSNRLRAVFPSIVCNSEMNVRSKCLNDEGDSAGNSESSQSSSSLSTENPGSIRIVKRQGDFWDHRRMSFKLSALQVVVSSLEIVSRTITTSSSQTIDLLDDFWRSILAYMTETLQQLAVGSIFEPEREDSREREVKSYCPKISSTEVAFVVKALRLLNRFDSKLIGPYVRYSLLPFISNALEYGRQEEKRTRKSTSGKMLVRECERLLKSV